MLATSDLSNLSDEGKLGILLSLACEKPAIRRFMMNILMTTDLLADILIGVLLYTVPHMWLYPPVL